MPFDLTTATPEAGWHVSRRIPARYVDAVQALGDALRADPLLLSLGPDVVVGGVRYLRPGEARGFTARLRLGPVHGATRVEVQVEPWSHGESALGLRPTRRAPRARADRYFVRALALLADLEQCVLDRVSVPEQREVRRAS
jgi:hypothetical protein